MIANCRCTDEYHKGRCTGKIYDARPSDPLWSMVCIDCLINCPSESWPPMPKDESGNSII